MNQIKKSFLHVDLDAFFASVEQLDHPEYKGKPVIVGGLPEDRRSVVSTASYEARKFGVHSAMPVFKAFKLCPQGIFLRGRMSRYHELSYKVMSIFKDFSPDVYQISIDEAFIDITGTENLFGPAEEVAKKIKYRVLKETGLTVSIGGASTQYLAKIASGYKKPDGLFFIKEGTETQFMLSLPLEKVWGIGEKTLENLHSKGFFKTEDIYNSDLQTLEFLFGKTSAEFFYDIVRGGKAQDFGKESKSHSISEENTFLYDITDSYTAKTRLLELCQNVFFRLLKEKGFSRTAFLKIKYNDFKTVTIQKTQETSILTVDSFYEIIAELFDKKFDKERGIRLLGVGFENIEKEEKPFQQSLFGEKDEKKQKVEKAILELNKKHPEIKIQKARLLKLVLLPFFVFSLSHFHLYSENETSITGAGSILNDSFEKAKVIEKDTIYNFKLNDKDVVNFFVKGIWNGTIEGTANISWFNDSTPSISLETPVFTQEVDLSVDINLNNQWYFKSDFQDEFNKNTFSIGYKDENLSAILSSGNLGFPEKYKTSASAYNLGKGTNLSPGTLIHYENGNLETDFILKYDLSKTKTKTFYGFNEVNDTKIDISNYVKNQFFVFNQENKTEIENIKNVYVENKSGSYRDKNGKKYIKLDSSQFYTLSDKNLLVISREALSLENPSILVTFQNEKEVNTIISSLGSYKNETTYLGKIQKWFSQSKSSINLSDYSCTLENFIDNSKALVLQNSTFFSPFAFSANYDLGIEGDYELSVIYKSSESELKDFNAEVIDDTFLLINENYFLNKHSYAFINSSENTDFQKPETRYPFAAVSPETYLNLSSNNDIALLKRQYSAVNQMEIGQNINAGTVQIYVNSILDSKAKYNEENGTITLSSAVSENDKIYVIYQEEDKNGNSGFLSSEGGIYYTINPFLHTASFVVSSWPLFINSKYSSPEDLKRGYSAFNTGIFFEKDSLSISDETSICVENNNLSGNLLLVSQGENTSKTYYLSKYDGYKTLNKPEIKGLSLSDESSTIENFTGITDSDISGYKIPLSFNFYGKGENNWASIDLKINEQNIIKNSTFIEFAIKPEFSASTKPNSLRIFIQEGIKASSENYGEDSENICTFEITDQLDLSKSSWQTVKIALSDKEKAKLNSESDVRFVVVNTKENGENGTLFIGPYEPYIESVNLEADEKLNCYSYSTKDTECPSINDLELSENYVTTLNFQNNFYQSETPSIFTASYFESTNLFDYRYLNLDISFSKEIKTIKLILDNDAQSIKENGNEALILVIKNPDSKIIINEKIQKLQIDLQNLEVYLNGEKLNSDNYEITENKSFIPCRFKTEFQLNSTDDKTHSIKLGNLYLSNINAAALLQNQLDFQYKNSIFYVDSSSSQAKTLTAQDFAISENLKTGLTLDYFNFDAETSLKYTNTSNSNIFTSSGYDFYNSKKLFNTLKYKEEYKLNYSEKTVSKNDSLSLDFSELKVPLKFEAYTNAKNTGNINKTENKLLSDFSLENSILGLDLNFYCQADQYINSKNKYTNPFDYSSYFKSWYEISTLQFSKGSQFASKRNLIYFAKLKTDLKQLNFSPLLSYSLSSNYKNQDDINQLNQNIFTIELPYEINKNTFNFTYKKTVNNKIQSVNNNSSYFSDNQLLFKDFDNLSLVFKTIPFYELFDKKLANLMEQNSSSLFKNYSSNYILSWNKPLYNSTLDFFIPQKISLSITKDITKTSSITEILQSKLSFNYNAVNIFDFDNEFSSSLNLIYKITDKTPETSRFQLNGYTQFILFLNNQDNLKTAFNYSFEDKTSWNIENTDIFEYKGKESLPTLIASYFIPTENAVDFKIKRKETVNCNFSKEDDLFCQNYSLSHTLQSDFMKFYTIKQTFETGLSIYSTGQVTLEITLKLTGQVSF